MDLSFAQAALLGITNLDEAIPAALGIAFLNNGQAGAEP
jgi:hypothetical protein